MGYVIKYLLGLKMKYKQISNQLSCLLFLQLHEQLSKQLYGQLFWRLQGQLGKQLGDQALIRVKNET